MTRYRQAAACPRAAQKTQTYRSLRFPAVAALVPSAGTITLKIELRSDADAVSTLAFGACPRCAACVPRIKRATQDTGADHARPAILELQILTSPKQYRIEMEAHLPSFDQLRNNAAECIRLAEAAHTPAHKSYFIEMADRWLTLAERAQKDAR